MTAAANFVGVLLEEVNLLEIQALMELNLLNRPEMEAFILDFALQVKDEQARKIFQKQATSYLANSEKDARTATVADLGDEEVPEWVIRCREKQQEVHVFDPGPRTPEVMGLMVEYLNENPKEAKSPYAFKDLRAKVLEYHLHPDAEVKKDFHTFTKEKQPDGTVIYTIAPVSTWAEDRAARDTRRAERIAARNADIVARNAERPPGDELEREAVTDSDPLTLRLMAKDKLVIGISLSSYGTLNPSNSTEMRDNLRHLIKREKLDILSSMPRLAKLSDGHTVIGLLSDAARDYAGVMMKNCIGLGNYDSGCTTYAIINSLGEFVVAIATCKLNGQADEALGFANEEIKTSVAAERSYRWKLYDEFCAVPGLKFVVVRLANGGQCKDSELQPGHIVTSKLDYSDRDMPDLPENLTCQGGLVLGRMKVPVLPSGLKVKGVLDLRKSGISDLPAGLEVDGTLDIRGTAVHTIPDGLKIKELKATRGTIDLDSVHRWLVFNTTAAVRDKYVNVYCKDPANKLTKLTDEQCHARFDKEILPKFLSRVKAVNLDQPCPPEYPLGDSRRDGANTFWKHLTKVFEK